MNIFSSFFPATALFIADLPSMPNKGKQNDKLKASVGVVTEFSKQKGEIPAKLFKGTQGIVISPKLINAGTGLAVKRGSGLTTDKRTYDSWSNPVL